MAQDGRAKVDTGAERIEIVLGAAVVRTDVDEAALVRVLRAARATL